MEIVRRQIQILNDYYKPQRGKQPNFLGHLCSDLSQSSVHSLYIPYGYSNIFESLINFSCHRLIFPPNITKSPLES